MATTMEDVTVVEEDLGTSPPSPPPPPPPLTRKVLSPMGRETNDSKNVNRTPTLRAFRGIWQAKVKSVHHNSSELQKRVFISDSTPEGKGASDGSQASLSSSPSPKPPSVFQIDFDASGVSGDGKHSDNTVQVKVTRPRQLWQPLSSWKRKNKVAPSPQGGPVKRKVAMTTAPHSSEHNPLSDKENLGPPATPPPPPPLRRKIDKLTVSSEASLASFTPVSPLYDITQPEDYSTPIVSPKPDPLLTPKYSKVRKKKPLQLKSPTTSPPPLPPPPQVDNRYAQPLPSSPLPSSPLPSSPLPSSPLPSSLLPSSPLPGPINNVLRVLSLSDDRDSLYESLQEEPEDHAYTEVVDPASSDQVRLISIKGRQPEGGTFDEEAFWSDVGTTPSPSTSEIFPLHYAAAKGDRKELERIIGGLTIIQDPVERVLGSKKFRVREGIDVKDGEGRTALMHAVHNDHIDCVQVLAKAGANVNIEAPDGSTCLHEGAYSGTLKMVALLLSLGADGMKKDNNGRLPIHWSTNNYNSDCIRILLDKVPGLGPNVSDGSHMTPLMWAGFHGRPDNVQLLKQKGGDTGSVDCGGMRAIHWSVKSRDLKTLQSLLSPDSAKYQDLKGKTVLHYIAENGFSKAVPVVKGVCPLSISDCDHNGRTALHWATVCEKPDVIRALLAAGADPNIQDIHGMTPLDYALKKRLPYCALLLSQAQDNRDHSNDDDDDDVRQASISYRHVITLGGSTGIGVRTLMQQEGRVLDQEIGNGKLSNEHVLQMKAVCTGAWINKFTANGKGPLHPRFLWMDPTSMNVYWAKNIESRYISSKETKNDSLIGVRHSASSAILRRKDFDPIVKHKYAFTIFTKNKILNVVALSSEDFKTWLNGLQLILHLGTERSLKVVNGRPSLRNY